MWLQVGNRAGPPNVGGVFRPSLAFTSGATISWAALEVDVAVTLLASAVTCDESYLVEARWGGVALPPIGCVASGGADDRQVTFTVRTWPANARRASVADDSASVSSGVGELVVRIIAADGNVVAVPALSYTLRSALQSSPRLTQPFVSETIVGNDRAALTGRTVVTVSAMATEVWAAGEGDGELGLHALPRSAGYALAWAGTTRGLSDVPADALELAFEFIVPGGVMHVVDGVDHLLYG